MLWGYNSLTWECLWKWQDSSCRLNCGEGWVASAFFERLMFVVEVAGV